MSRKQLLVDAERIAPGDRIIPHGVATSARLATVLSVAVTDHVRLIVRPGGVLLYPKGEPVNVHRSRGANRSP